MVMKLAAAAAADTLFEGGAIPLRRVEGGGGGGERPGSLLDLSSLQSDRAPGEFNNCTKHNTTQIIIAATHVSSLYALNPKP